MSPHARPLTLGSREDTCCSGAADITEQKAVDCSTGHTAQITQRAMRCKAGGNVRGTVQPGLRGLRQSTSCQASSGSCDDTSALLSNCKRPQTCAWRPCGAHPLGGLGCEVLTGTVGSRAQQPRSACCWQMLKIQTFARGITTRDCGHMAAQTAGMPPSSDTATPVRPKGRQVPVPAASRLKPLRAPPRQRGARDGGWPPCR